MTVWLDDGDVRLHHGDALTVLRDMPDEAVDACVTSPPYADMRDYGGATPDLYGDWLTPYLRELYRVTTDTGSLLLNVGRTRRRGVELPIAEDARRAAESAGWLWVDTLIWHKPNAFYAASAPYLHDTHEYVWWLAKSPGCYRGYDTDTRTTHKATTIARYAQGFRTNRSKNGTHYHTPGKRINAPHHDGACPKSVVTHPIADHRGIDHPAPMSLKLARHLVSLSTPAGGLVIDPFCGSGTTCLAARQRGRRSIGIDHHEQYLTVAARRLQQLSLLAEAP